MVTGVVPSPPRFLPSIFITHRVQQSHCSSIFHRGLLTHALALSASHFVHKKKSQRIYTSMRSAGLELTKLTYTRLEDNLIRHRGDRLYQRTKMPGTKIRRYEDTKLSQFSHFPFGIFLVSYICRARMHASIHVHPPRLVACNNVTTTQGYGSTYSINKRQHQHATKPITTGTLVLLAPKVVYRTHSRQGNRNRKASENPVILKRQLFTRRTYECLHA